MTQGRPWKVRSAECLALGLPWTLALFLPLARTNRRPEDTRNASRACKIGSRAHVVRDTSPGRFGGWTADSAAGVEMSSRGGGGVGDDTHNDAQLVKPQTASHDKWIADAAKCPSGGGPSLLVTPAREQSHVHLGAP